MIPYIGMPAKKAKPTVLILDDDLGFAMWLGGALNDAGLRAIPASRTAEALAITSEALTGRIDVLIANFKVAGSRGFLRRMAERQPRLKVIAIGRAGPRQVDARIHRPPRNTVPDALPYTKTVLRVLR